MIRSLRHLSKTIKSSTVDSIFTLGQAPCRYSNMPNLVLYKLNASPPSCAVMMLGKILGLNFDFVEPGLLKMEHKAPEFLKMNPKGTIPVLKDGDFVLSESHAILTYLVSKYGGEHREKLYPNDPEVRALIDERMHFDTGIFFIRLKVVALPTLLEGLEAPSQKQLDDIDEAYGVVEAYLAKGSYVVGNHLTIADLSLGTTAFSMQGIHKLDAQKFPRTAAWLARLAEEPYFKAIGIPGSQEFSGTLAHFWAKNKK